MACLTSKCTNELDDKCVTSLFKMPFGHSTIGDSQPPSQLLSVPPSCGDKHEGVLRREEGFSEKMTTEGGIGVSRARMETTESTEPGKFSM